MRRRPWIPRSRRRSSEASFPSSTRRSSSWPTASRRSRWSTGSWGSKAAGSRRPQRTPSCSPIRGTSRWCARTSGVRRDGDGDEQPRGSEPMSATRENEREPYAEEDVLPPLAEEFPMPAEPSDLDELEELEHVEPIGGLGGAISVLRRGLRESPEMRAGIGFTIALALADTVGRLLVPILIQVVIDHGIDGPEGFRPAFVYASCAGAAVAVVLIYFAGRAAYTRLTRASGSAP